MNRRTVLKAASLATWATAVSVKGFSRILPATQHANTGFFQFKAGGLDLLVVTDGHALFQPVQPIFAPLATPASVSDVLAANFLPTSGIDLAFNVLVWRNDKQVILFDAGCGPHFGPAAGKLEENLSAAGIRRQDVTDILLTHAHPDHVGGLADKDGILIFPNARVWMARQEYDFWMQEKPDFSKSKADPAFAASMVRLAKANLTAAGNRLNFFQGGETLFDSLKLEIIPGHTPGHTISTLGTGEEALVHMGDIAHDHVLLLSHPEWGVAFDTDFEAAAKARRAALQSLANKRSRLFSYHLPWPGLGFVRSKGDAFEWIQQPFSTPQL